MTRTARRRVPTSVAMGVGIAATLLVMSLPGVGFGQTSVIEGGTPERVIMKTTTRTCLSMDTDGGNAAEQEVVLGDDAHLLVYFTGEWGGLQSDEEGLIGLYLTQDGQILQGSKEWGFPGTRITRTSGTVMWSFPDVAPGTYTVVAGARVDPTPPGPGGGAAVAGLNDCALTIFVMPPA